MWEAHHVHPCTMSNMSWSSHQSLPWQKPMMENSIENSRSLPDSAKKYRTHKGTVQALQVNLGFGKLGLVSIQYHPISSNIIQYHPISSNNPTVSSNIIQSSIQSSCHGSHRHRGNPLPGWGFAAAFHVANPGFTWRIGSRCHKMTQLGTTHLGSPQIATGFSGSLAYFASPQVVWDGAHQSDHQKNLSQDEPRT